MRIQFCAQFSVVSCFLKCTSLPFLLNTCICSEIMLKLHAIICSAKSCSPAVFLLFLTRSRDRGGQRGAGSSWASSVGPSYHPTSSLSFNLFMMMLSLQKKTHILPIGRWAMLDSWRLASSHPKPSKISNYLNDCVLPAVVRSYPRSA